MKAAQVYSKLPLQFSYCFCSQAQEEREKRREEDLRTSERQSIASYHRTLICEATAPAPLNMSQLFLLAFLRLSLPSLSYLVILSWLLLSPHPATPVNFAYFCYINILCRLLCAVALVFIHSLWRGFSSMYTIYLPLVNENVASIIKRASEWRRHCSLSSFLSVCVCAWRRQVARKCPVSNTWRLTWVNLINKQPFYKFIVRMKWRNNIDQLVSSAKGQLFPLSECTYAKIIYLYIYQTCELLEKHRDSKKR